MFRGVKYKKSILWEGKQKKDRREKEDAKVENKENAEHSADMAETPGNPADMTDKINAARQSGATSLDLSGVDTGSVVGMHEMFLGCSSLETVYLGDGWTDEWIECVKHAYPEIHFVMK